MGNRTAGDVMFERYLGEQGYDQPEHEPDLGVGKRPDYVISRDGQRCVVDVKEFAQESSPFPVGQRAGSMSSQTVLKPIRGQLREAARKFQPMQHLGLPLVVVLANPYGVMLDPSVDSVIHAMYGDPAFTFPVSAETGGASGPGRFIASRNGRLRSDHQYVSAVGLLGCRTLRADHIHEMFKDQDLSLAEGLRLVEAADSRGEIPDGDRHVITLIKVANDIAVPLPDCFFHGVEDRVFEHDQTTDSYAQVRGPEQ